MTNRTKQNWRYATADHRWRNREVWPTTDQDERRLIRYELRRGELSDQLDRLWLFLYQHGYDPKAPDRSYPDFASEWTIINDLMREQERLAARSRRLEEKTGRDADQLMTEYRQINVKSVCF